MNTHSANAYIEALRWHIDNDLDAAYTNEAVDCTAIVKVTPSAPPKSESPQGLRDNAQQAVAQAQAPMVSNTELIDEAQKRANEANTLQELKEAIAAFEGLAIKKTATQIVFADGNPDATLMIIGETPGADDDRQGLSFSGAHGQLLDTMLQHINISRQAETKERSAYLTNILNWRPPGNRSPTQEEMEICRPFIEKHIALIKPKAILMTGAISAKTLLGKTESISRLRGTWHDYTPKTIENAESIPAIATYHPSYLLNSPAQKKQVWQDLLRLKEKLKMFSA